MQSITVWCGITKGARSAIMNAEPAQFGNIADVKLFGLIGIESAADLRQIRCRLISV